LGEQIFWWEFFHGGNSPRGGKFPGNEIVRKNFTLGEFVRIPIQNSCFLFSVSILRAVLLKVIVLGKLSPGLKCVENIFVGRVFRRGGGARFPGII